MKNYWKLLLILMFITNILAIIGSKKYRVELTKQKTTINKLNKKLVECKEDNQELFKYFTTGF